MKRSTNSCLRYDVQAAARSLPPGMDLAVTVDTLVSGVHFPLDTAPADIGYKALAVSLSDLAAMGAVPDWAAVTLTVPEVDEGWIAAFHGGMNEIAHCHDVQFPVGDLGRGPLATTLQLYGQVPRGQALRRDGAHPGDLVFVTGTLGDAGLALAGRFSAARLDVPEEHLAFVSRRLARPTPRVAAGMALRGIATAAIDISDGLAADLGHIAEASGLSAMVEVERLPLSHALEGLADRALAWRLALSSGDDYELCFTVPPERTKALTRAAKRLSCPVTRIGHMARCPGVEPAGRDSKMESPGTGTGCPGVQVLHGDGRPFSQGGGYQHFTSTAPHPA
uniref:Thiamine-monophosphate kinase n=1 Tax=Candidatus Kentrum sp. LFY TaxID=2126342 RepID=A0A450V2Q1_9GAMM|nr:MAG: thiamine-phosphate kinase [Candidatus Kentron sp. LFY]